MSLNTTDRLERLARLHTSGALDAQEYAAAKAQLFSTCGPTSPVKQPPRPGLPAGDAPTTTGAALSPTWQLRFRFFDEHGLPGTPGCRVALRGMPAWSRVRIGFSPLAMLFGPFYFLYLGLWRPTLVLLSLTILFDLLIYQLGLNDDLDHALWVIPAALHGACVVPLYYLQQRYSLRRWNPFGWRPDPIGRAGLHC